MPQLNVQHERYGPTTLNYEENLAIVPTYHRYLSRRGVGEFRTPGKNRMLEWGSLYDMEEVMTSMLSVQLDAFNALQSSHCCEKSTSENIEAPTWHSQKPR